MRYAPTMRTPMSGPAAREKVRVTFVMRDQTQDVIAERGIARARFVEIRRAIVAMPLERGLGGALDALPTPRDWAGLRLLRGFGSHMEAGSRDQSGVSLHFA